MKRALLLASILSIIPVQAIAQQSRRASVPHTAAAESDKPSALDTASPNRGVLFHPTSVASEGIVDVEGQRIDYRAIAGTIIVHPQGWDDASWREQQLAKENGEKSTGDDSNK